MTRLNLFWFNWCRKLCSGTTCPAVFTQYNSRIIATVRFVPVYTERFAMTNQHSSKFIQLPQQLHWLQQHAMTSSDKQGSGAIRTLLNLQPAAINTATACQHMFAFERVHSNEIILLYNLSSAAWSCLQVVTSSCSML